MNELEFRVISYETTQDPNEADLDIPIDAMQSSTEAPDALVVEQQVLASPEESQTSWPESNPDGTISEADYLQRCRWRLAMSDMHSMS